MRKTLIISITAVALAAAWPASAERVPVRTETNDTSALVTFAWSDPVAYTHEVENGRLTVRFSRPIEGSFSALAERLGGVVTTARAGNDGRSVSFDLAQPVDVYAFYTGTAVTVELVRKAEAAPTERTEPEPANAEVSAPPIREKRAKAAAQSVPADAPTVGVRTGEHPDYTRVVFDFEDDVPYQVNAADGVVTIRFQRVANIDTGPLNAGGIPFLGGARSTVVGGETVVTLTVPATSTVRDLLSGSKVVVDIRAPSGDATPVAMPAADTAPAQPETETAETSLPGSAPTTPVERAAPVEPAAADAPPPPPVTGSAANTKTTKTPAAEDNRPRALTADGNQPQSAAATAANNPDAAVPDETLSPRAQPLDDNVETTPADVTAYPGDDQLVFRFNFEEPVAAATFRRGGAVWIAFDKPLEVDTAALQTQAGEAAFEILQLPSDGATVLRIRTSRRYNPAVKRDGLAWIIDLAERPLAPQTPLVVKAQPESPIGARVFIPVAEPGRAIPVTDPNVGDNFVIVPVIPLGQAIGRDHRFPQFSVSLSAQGVVINPLIDDLRVRSLRQGVEIGSSGVRLAISNVSDDAAAHAELASSRPMVKAIEELDRYYATLSQFRVVRREMEGAVVAAEEKRKTAPRLELAKFFFANAHAPETLGVLRVAIADLPLLEDDPSVRVMRGGSNFLLGRYEEALADLTHESVADNDEARLWAAATRAVTGDRIGAARDLRYTGSIARDYPRALKMPLGILIAEVAAETGDSQGAQLFLEALNLENPTKSEQAMLKFAEGKLKQQEGDFETAIALWEDVIESENRPARARARVALTEMLLKLRRIDHREAIEEYETLRFAWRGDKMEFDNLRRLGGLYLDEGYYRKGLATLKAAATHFREYPEAPEITKLMSDTFNALFLGDAADEIDPVKAIAIYNEFKELTPAGSRGDAMIRNLADKLVEVDLLDRAAELLRAQVQFRLEGVEKARVGARLALIYTLAREYERALEVLQGTAESNLPAELQVQRRHLNAQVMMGLSRPNDALRLLADDESENAELLRTEIYWNGGNWLEAARSLRHLVRLSGAEEGVPLETPQAARILNYAVALTNSGGERAIAKLVQDYGPGMRQTKYGEAFQLVTTPATVGTLSPTAVSAKVDEAETFLAAYRDKLKDGVPLSSMN